MRRAEYFIGIVMSAGLLLSVLIVMVGGFLYLLQNGNHLIQYHLFQHQTCVLFSIKRIWREVIIFSPCGIIELGLLTLVLTQVLRVGLTAWLFIEERDYIFTWISLTIMAILIYSIFWRN